MQAELIIQEVFHSKEIIVFRKNREKPIQFLQNISPFVQTHKNFLFSKKSLKR